MALDSNHVLYCRFNGNYTDETGRHTLLPQGATALSTAQKVFGTGSVEFSGASTDQIWISDSEDWNFSGGIFTIQMRYRPKSVAAGTYTLLSQWGDGGSNGSIYIAYQTNAGGGGQKKFYFFKSQDGASEEVHEYDTTASPLAINTWYAIAVIGYGSSMALYINGIRVAVTGVIGTSWHNSTRRLNVSGYADGSSALQTLNGYVDELIISNVARYSGASYTVETAELVVDDAIPPAITISTREDQYLTGTRQVCVNITDSAGIDSVVFTLNDVVISTQDGGGSTSGQFCVTIDTTAYDNGEYTLEVTATDINDNEDSESVTINIFNPTSTRSTGDSPHNKGQHRECVICGFWYPERDSRIRLREGKWVCKWDDDTLTENERADQLNRRVR